MTDQFATNPVIAALVILALLFFALRGRKDITRAKLGGRNKTLDKERDR